MSDSSPGEGWWQASDGKWYPPERKPWYVAAAERDEALAPSFLRDDQGSQSATDQSRLPSFLRPEEPKSLPRPVPPEPQRQRRTRSESSLSVNHLNAALVLSGMVILGTIGPWLKVFVFVPISISGLDTPDGKLVAVLGLLAVGVSLWMRAGLGASAGRVFLGLLGAATTAACLYDANNVTKEDGVSLGWGLYLDILAGVGLVLLALAAAPATRETLR